MSKAIVSITNLRPERDIIRISDDRYSVIYRVNVRTATAEEEHLIAIVAMINNAEVRVWPRFDGRSWIAEDREG